MKIKKGLSIFIAMCLCVCFTACAQNDNNIKNDNTTVSEASKATESQTTVNPTTVSSDESKSESTTENTTEDATEAITESKKDIILNNEYVTKYEEVNMVTYPPFIFNYPDNWNVVREECDPQEELVTLENGEGASVTFMHYSGKLEGGGSRLYMSKEKISKAAPSQFVPGFVQATDHSSLGEFMVAKIKTTGIMDTTKDSEFTDVDGNVSYAVLPVSEEGTREGAAKALSEEYSFWYSSTISFTASDTEDFTLQEQQEVIAILNSFRLKYRY